MRKKKDVWLADIGLSIHGGEHWNLVQRSTIDSQLAEVWPKKKRRWLSQIVATWLFYTVGVLVIPFVVAFGLLLVWAYILDGVDNPFVGIACGMVGIGVYLGCELFLSDRDYIY